MSRDWTGRAVGILFSVVLMIGIEFACRLFEPADTERGPLQSISSILERDDTFFWVGKSGLKTSFFGEEIHLDRFGFRNPDVEPARGASDELRILIIGASPSFGWGVREEGVYARVLENHLAQGRAGRVRVFNASVIGYSSWQGLQVLKRYLDYFRPDQVVASFGINDVTRERFYYSGPWEDKDLKVSHAALGNFLSRLSVVRLLTGLRARWAGPSAVSPGAPYPVRVSTEDFIQNHLEMLRITREAKAGFRVLIIPFHFPESGVEIAGIGPAREAESRAAGYFSALRDFSRKQGVPLVDTSQALLQDYDSHYLVGKRDFIHPSEEGHRVIAALLLRSFKELHSDPGERKSSENRGGNRTAR